MAEEEGVEKDAGAKGGMNSKFIMIIILAIALLGGGGGAAWYLMGDDQKNKKEGEMADHEVEAEPSLEAIGPVVDLEPFVLNLADRDQLRYLKVSIKLQLDRPEAETDFQNRLPAIRDALLVLLTSKESRALRTIDGKMLVRDEIGGRVNSIMKKGKIRQVFFTDFIIQ